MDRMPPLVSVLIPSYNHERYIEGAIRSVINQTYKNIEIIVIDDGSVDKSPEILLELSEKHNFYYKRQDNIGLPATLNKLIQIAQGKYISMLASDDLNIPDKVELLVERFEQLTDDYAVVCGNATFINDSGKNISLRINNNEYHDFIQYYTSNRDYSQIMAQFGSYKTLLIGNYIPAPCTLIKRNMLIEVGLYEEDIYVEDWNMWLKLSKKYKIAHVDNNVALYRWHHTNSMTIMENRLYTDAINILVREKPYCIGNGLITAWKKGYFNLILCFYRNNEYYQFFNEIISNRLFSLFFKHIFKKFIRAT